MTELSPMGTVGTLAGVQIGDGLSQDEVITAKVCGRCVGLDWARLVFQGCWSVRALSCVPRMDVLERAGNDRCAWREQTNPGGSTPARTSSRTAVPPACLPACLLACLLCCRSARAGRTCCVTCGSSTIKASSCRTTAPRSGTCRWGARRAASHATCSTQD